MKRFLQTLKQTRWNDQTGAAKIRIINYVLAVVILVGFWIAGQATQSPSQSAYAAIMDLARLPIWLTMGDNNNNNNNNNLTVTITSPDENDIFLRGQEIIFNCSASQQDVNYSWSVLDGSCSPSYSTTQTFKTTLSSTGQIRVGIQVEKDGHYGADLIDVEAIVPEVTEVSFLNTNTLKKYPSGTMINNPVWIKALGESNPSKNDPFTYRRNYLSGATIKINSEKNLDQTAEIYVRGISYSHYIEYEDKYTTYTSGPVTISNMDALNSFYNHIYLSTFSISWEYKVKKTDGSYGYWQSLEITDHPFYITYDDPLENPFDYSLDISCNAAFGENILNTILGDIMTDIDDHTTYNPAWQEDEDYPDLNIYNNTGHCYQHTNLMIHLCKTQGISGTLGYYMFGTDRFNPSQLMYRYINGATGLPCTFFISCPAHDEAPANPHYLKHKIVWWNNFFWDPSYGTSGLPGCIAESPNSTMQYSFLDATDGTWDTWTCNH